MIDNKPKEGSLMLVVTRKMGERIFINNGEVIITVTYLARDKVRIGVQAPRDMVVDREEVFLAKQKELKAQARHKELMGELDLKGESNESNESEAEDTQKPHEQQRPTYEG